MPTYHHGNLRAAVLASAGKLIEKEGLAGLSVREAARRAGVSHNAPYRHFPDRDALLAAVAIEGFDLLGESLQDLSGRELGEAYVRFARQHPQRFRLMFAGHAQGQAIQSHFARAFAGVGGEARYAAAAAWALVHGLADLILDGHFEADDEFVRKVIGAIRFAVGRDAAAQRSA